MSSISVRFNSFSFFIRFSMNIKFLDSRRVVGLDGLEPSTSRLSGVRSNHLSYKPFFSLIWYWFAPSSSSTFRLTGGDDGVRTHDPLLAGQVLSQLSYTPVSGLLFPLSKIRYWSLKIEQQKFHTSFHSKRLSSCFSTPTTPWKVVMVSIERRWSSRTFRYGYLVTT